MTLSEASTPQDRIMQQSPEGRPYSRAAAGAEDVILSEAASVSEPRSRRLVLPALSRVEGSAVERNLGVADICSARRMELCNSLNNSLFLSLPGQLRPPKLGFDATLRSTDASAFADDEVPLRRTEASSLRSTSAREGGRGEVRVKPRRHRLTLSRPIPCRARHTSCIHT